MSEVYSLCARLLGATHKQECLCQMGQKEGLSVLDHVESGSNQTKAAICFRPVDVLGHCRPQIALIIVLLLLGINPLNISLFVLFEVSSVCAGFEDLVKSLRLPPSSPSCQVFWIARN